MHEILRLLPPGSYALDLGCGPGSFRDDATRAFVLRVDAERPLVVPRNFFLADAAALPFRSRAVSAIISNHSLEHLRDLHGCIREICRVVKHDGFIYVAIPDASTLADRIYRWLGRGGGHVNPFIDPGEVPRQITAASGLPLAAMRELRTSLSFLNRHNISGRPQLRLLLFANGSELLLRWFTYALRLVDVWFGWRTSVYGWAYYFGRIEGVDPNTCTNVCVRCGSAHGMAWLQANSHVRRRWLLPDSYLCPACGTKNLFTPDPIVH